MDADDRLPIDGERNVLITSALPYCNNVPHLGEFLVSGFFDFDFVTLPLFPFTSRLSSYVACVASRLELKLGAILTLTPVIPDFPYREHYREHVERRCLREVRHVISSVFRFACGMGTESE